MACVSLRAVPGKGVRWCLPNGPAAAGSEPLGGARASRRRRRRRGFSLTPFLLTKGLAAPRRAPDRDPERRPERRHGEDMNGLYRPGSDAERCSSRPHCARWPHPARGTFIRAFWWGRGGCHLFKCSELRPRIWNECFHR